MSIECTECERDLRGGHDPSCSRYVAPCCDQADEEGCPVHPNQSFREFQAGGLDAIRESIERRGKRKDELGELRDRMNPSACNDERMMRCACRKCLGAVLNGRRTAEGLVVDPTVWGILHTIRAKAYQLGYAVAFHGSMTKDLDLLAVPWTDDAVDANRLVEWICAETGLFVSPPEPTSKPHGRIAWSLHAIGWAGYIDLSVFPRQNIDNLWGDLGRIVRGAEIMTPIVIDAVAVGLHGDMTTARRVAPHIVTEILTRLED